MLMLPRRIWASRTIPQCEEMSPLYVFRGGRTTFNLVRRQWSVCDRSKTIIYFPSAQTSKFPSPQGFGVFAI